MGNALQKLFSILHKVAPRMLAAAVFAAFILYMLNYIPELNEKNMFKLFVILLLFVFFYMVVNDKPNTEDILVVVLCAAIAYWFLPNYLDKRTWKKEKQGYKKENQGIEIRNPCDEVGQLTYFINACDRGDVQPKYVNYGTVSSRSTQHFDVHIKDLKLGNLEGSSCVVIDFYLACGGNTQKRAGQLIFERL